MDFKKHYINGNISFKLEFRFSTHWNNLMLLLTRITTFDPQRDVVIYPYAGEGIKEKIESWYEKPKYWWLTRKNGVQYTRSTFYDTIKKKEIIVKHFSEIIKITQK